MKKTTLWVELQTGRVHPPPNPQHHGSIIRTWKVCGSGSLLCFSEPSSGSEHQNQNHWTFWSRRSQVLMFGSFPYRTKFWEVRPAAQEPAVLRRRPHLVMGATQGENHAQRFWSGPGSICVVETGSCLCPQLAQNFHPSAALFAQTLLQVEPPTSTSPVPPLDPVLMVDVVLIHRETRSSTLETRSRTSPSSGSWTALSSGTPNS